MSRPIRMLPAILLALGVATAAPAAQPPSNPSTPAPGEAESAPQAAEPAESYPIFWVSSIEVLRTTHEPITDVVVVSGLTSGEGWTSGELVPLRHGDGSDGVLDLVFVGQAPPESAPPTGYAPIVAVLPLPAGHPFRGVRVRSATNSVVMHKLPGFTATKTPHEPCNPCIGKLLLAKGAVVPAGMAATDVVHEEDLPPNTRIIRPDDGLADMRPNPNRLTLIVGESGKVVDAAWE